MSFEQLLAEFLKAPTQGRGQGWGRPGQADVTEVLLDTGHRGPAGGGLGS